MARVPVDELVNAERVVDGLHELSANVIDSPLANEDIIPVPVKKRTWSMWNLAALWVGIAVCIPTYMLAAGLIANGMNWKQALLTILLGNAIVLIPMCLNAYPGTKYGIPFPVLIRSSFGTVGAHIPSVLRSLVACGWFGIQTWIGGAAIYTLVVQLDGSFAELGTGLKSSIGITGGELICFLGFWLLHMTIVYLGTESIRVFETWAAPALIVVGVALLVWALWVGGGFGPVLDQSEYFIAPSLSAEVADGVVRLKLDPIIDADNTPRVTHMRSIISERKLEDEAYEQKMSEAEFKPIAEEVTYLWPERADDIFVYAQVRSDKVEGVVSNLSTTLSLESDGAAGASWWLMVFLPGLTGMVGFWATLSLNIPDFTRFAKSQKDQVWGQVIGLPSTMTLYAFVGVMATCASLLAFQDVLTPETAPWNPVTLLAHFKIPWMVILSMAVLAIATLTTNVAANVVAPAVGFSNLAPRKISFRVGGFITGLIGIVIMPWKLMENPDVYIGTWLIGYSSLMGGIAAVMIADYYVVRKRKLNLVGLYQPNGPYKFTGGVNWVGVAAFALGVLPNIPGFLVQLGTLEATSIPEFLLNMYKYAWFSSFAIAFTIYAVVMPLTMKKEEDPAAPPVASGA